MSKKSFKAESKKLLDLMIHSIYTNKEIFLRELISNASDALDKRYYQVLSDENSSFDKENFYIRIETDKEKHTLTIRDTGIGMTKEELESNLGTIAKSGSLDFKSNNEPKDGVEIIGQFGVGFYSAFMVAANVKVQSCAVGSQESWEWFSEGADGYSLQQGPAMDPGTVITLTLKEDTEEEKYSEYLETYRLKSLIAKHSDFIKYPIKMEITHKILKKDNGKEFEDKIEDEILNNMVPIWRKNKNELKDEDYDNFYMNKHFGFEKPLRHIHLNLDGAVSCTAILYIPTKTPYDFYTKEYQKGLELYSNGVMIMQKCGDLLPDYFSFVQGLVDSADLSLNISRELLQHDHQLKLIAKHIQNKIKSELLNMLNTDRETYESFFNNFGRQLKYGMYADWGMHKDILQDLLLFYSSTQKKLVTLKEYVSRIKEGQKAIYYASGETNEKLSRLPQTERLSDENYEILYFTDEVDEFAIQVLREYENKPFKNVSSGDLDLENNEKPIETEEQKVIFEAVKKELGDKINGVRASVRLKSHPACIATEGSISVEMEKALSHMPDNKSVKAQKFLEINTNHPVYAALETANKDSNSTFASMTRVLYNQALLIEGLPVEDPVAFSNDIWEIMKNNK